MEQLNQFNCFAKIVLKTERFFNLARSSLQKLLQLVRDILECYSSILSTTVQKVIVS